MEPPENGQYSLRKILTIWAIVAIPMPILAFVLAPAISPAGGWRYGITVWLMLISGMVWQFLVSAWILYHELDALTWSGIKARIWLQAPRDPKSGQTSYKLFFWLIPAFLVYVAFDLTPISEYVGNLVLIPFPWLAKLPVLELSSLAVPELVGAWWLVPIALVSCVFNYVLGEELLFRGILLPKSRGVFGKWDWVANAVLFSLYHLHRPTWMLGFVFGTMAWTLPSRYFKSIWFSIILHGFEGIFVVVGAIGVASGLAV